MPRCVVYMHRPARDPVSVRLWECRGWGTEEGIEIVQTHDGDWAVGTRDECADSKYAIRPSGYRLDQVEESEVIRLLTRQDYILPRDLQPTAAPPTPVNPPTASALLPSADQTPVELAAAGSGADVRAKTGKSTNAIVNEHLQRDERISAAEISRATGIPASTVRRSKAWTAHQDRVKQQKPERTDAMEHARSLTAPMLAVRKSEAADPADIAAEREAIDPTEARRRRFVETATPGQRARLNKLPPQQQARELEAWDLTGEFLPDDPPLPAPLRRAIQRRGERPAE
jgi:hypothetical protein